MIAGAGAPTGGQCSGGDRDTLSAYDRDAPSFAGEWDAQPPPSDMYALVLRFFRPGPTADIGCGAGRDTRWLNENGFAASGYDASAGLLAEARRRNPTLRFSHSPLPALPGVAENSFANVLCETVIMHLAHDAIAPSIRRLLAILRPGGTLYLSWRVTSGTDLRDPHGRLYAAFDPHLVLTELAQAEMLLDEEAQSASSGKTIRRLVARKPL